MASTRDVIAPPIFAEDASTTIPPTPIAGVSYRDPVAGPASSADGWPFAQLVNSAEFNQLMFQWSSLASIMDLKGILGWTNLKDYTEKAIAFGSDGNIYFWLQESGPGTGAGVQDPVSSPTYWQLLKDYVGANDTINAAIATIAAASTVNLTTGAPGTSQIAISGTGVSINGFTVAANRFFVVKFTGANTLVNGAPLVTNSGGNILTAAGDSCLMRATAANVVEVLGYARAAQGQVIHVRDQKAAGTDGGTFTSGAWRTRDLNTVLVNTVAGASLAANRVTLPAGTYETMASAPAVDTSGHQARLYDVTGAATLINGTSAFNAGAGVSAASLVFGRFTISVTSLIELQHACQTTSGTTGFGVGNTLAGQKAFEVYGDLFIRKVS